MAYFDKNTEIFLDNGYKKADKTTIDLYSQTLHYGQGVFEGIRSYKTKNGAAIFKAEAHYERLIQSCKLLGIPFEYTVDELIAISYQVLKKNKMEDAYIRPLVFCDPNMTLVDGTPSHLMICAWVWGAYLGEKQLRLKLSSYCRPHPKSTHIEAKASGHYINSILATSEAKRAGYDEAILLDCEGFIAEGPGANFFFEKNGMLFTASLGHILPGITRDTVLDLAQKLNIKVNQGRYTIEEVLEADSAFFCGTGAEVCGIQSIDETVFPLKWENSLGTKIKTAYLDLVRCKEVELV